MNLYFFQNFYKNYVNKIFKNLFEFWWLTLIFKDMKSYDEVANNLFCIFIND